VNVNELAMPVVEALIYPMALLASIGCMLILFHAYLRSGRRLLLWSALCFIGLSLNNLLLYVDFAFLLQTDIRVYRLCASLAGLLPLLGGIVWDWNRAAS
jgi:hypothetical protein